MSNDIPPRVRPEDFDALAAAMERCEATAMRVAETRKRLRLVEDDETKRLRAEVRDLKRRVRLAQRIASRERSAANSTGWWAVGRMLDALDLRRPLPRRAR